MIIDIETNKLFISPLLETKYPKFYAHFISVLKHHSINFEYLPKTKDVWCVDYMPIQLNEKEFVQFKYFPQYLRTKKHLPTISNVQSICEEINCNPKTSDLIIDGGNITRWKNEVIMTTRALTENPTYSITEFSELIKHLLKVDRVVFIPEQPSDFTGHSDGMVRYINKGKVLVNDYSDEPEKGFYNSLKAALHNAGLQTVTLPTTMYKNKTLQDAGGDYINYLQMKSHIFLPIFNQQEDKAVIDIFEREFPKHEIVPVLSSDLAKDGGIINCVTWNIKE